MPAFGRGIDQTEGAFKLVIDTDFGFVKLQSKKRKGQQLSASVSTSVPEITHQLLKVERLSFWSVLQEEALHHLNRVPISIWNQRRLERALVES